MLLPGENSPESWLFVTLLVFTITKYCESSGGKTFDIKLGFDLTHGAIGAPSLRIRDFEDFHEYHARALNGESGIDEAISEKPKTSVEDLAQSKNEDSSKELIKSESSDVSSDGGDASPNSSDDTVRVTRGAKGDFGPEEDDSEIHDKIGKISDTDGSSSEVRRRKRHIERFENVAKR